MYGGNRDRVEKKVGRRSKKVFCALRYEKYIGEIEERKGAVFRRDRGLHISIALEEQHKLFSFCKKWVNNTNIHKMSTFPFYF
jgi:hypothetical protein